MSDIFIPKTPHNFYCQKCDYSTSNKKDYKRHLMTLKHKNPDDQLTFTDNLGPKNTPKLKIYSCECGRHYKHRQSLFNHKKNCSNEEENIEDDNPLNEKEIIMTLLQQNNQLQNQIIELCKDKSITNINNTGAHIN